MLLVKYHIITYHINTHVVVNLITAAPCTSALKKWIKITTKITNPINKERFGTTTNQDQQHNSIKKTKQKGSKNKNKKNTNPN